MQISLTHSSLKSIAERYAVLLKVPNCELGIYVWTRSNSIFIDFGVNRERNNPLGFYYIGWQDVLKIDLEQGYFTDTYTLTFEYSDGHIYNKAFKRTIRIFELKTWDIDRWFLKEVHPNPQKKKSTWSWFKSKHGS